MALQMGNWGYKPTYRDYESIMSRGGPNFS